MRTMIYYDSYQKERYEKIKAENSAVLGILSEEMLFDKYIRQEMPILIILSQPSLKLMHALSKHQWTKVLVHLGIRSLEVLKSDYFVFENDMEFQQLYERSKHEQKEISKKIYLESIDLNDPLDMRYIESIYPEGVIKKVKLKKSGIRTSFKPGIITIMGNSEFAKVFAQALSHQIAGRVLVVDGDFLKPSMGVHFGIKKIQTSVESHLTGIDNTGINIALDALSKGLFLESFIEDVVLKINSHLNVLLGNYNVYNYEHFEMDQLNLLISQLKKMYDVVIISVSDHLYDQMTMVSLHQSHIVLLAPETNRVALRYIYQIIPLLKLKQGISEKKMSVVSFEKHRFSKGVKSISQSSLKALFPNQYMGSFRNKKKDMKKLMIKVQERMV